MSDARRGAGSSREPRSQPPRTPDLQLRYDTHDDAVVDVWLPAPGAGTDEQTSRLVVVVHGGFWRAEHDRSHAAAQCVALATAGYAVALPEYRRVGAGGGWPHTFDDVVRVLEQLPTQVSAAVPDRVGPWPPVLLGHSAGGHLALWAAHHHRSPVTASGVVALAPVACLDLARSAGLGAGAVDALLGELPASDIALIDPVALLPASTPVALVHGTADTDVPFEQSRAYAAAARDAGSPCALVALEGVGHFELIEPGTPAFAAVLDAVDAMGQLRPDA